MKRRTFIKHLSLSGLGITAFGLLDSRGKGLPFDNNLEVNGQRIERRIVELSKFGRDENGHGYRVAYTKGDIEGRAWFVQLMKNTGLDVAIDPGGNIKIGRAHV